MASYNVNKRGSRDVEIRRGQYYVWYLGWKECRALEGREYTEPIVKDLVAKRRKEPLPKLTIEVGKKELKIFQLVKGKFGRTEKFKFPTVPTKDVTYAVQGLPPDADIVACIYLGYNPTTRCAVHVHVYRCDSPDTAAVMVDNLTDILRSGDHQERIRGVEEQLVRTGEIVPRPRHVVHSYDADSVISTTPSTVHTVPDQTDLSDDDLDSGGGKPYSKYSGQEEEDPFSKEKEINMESLANELKLRFGNKNHMPILLPPQDYDTVRRFRGNLDLERFDDEEYENRKSKNKDIVGTKSSGAAEEAPRETPQDSSIPNRYLNNGYDDRASGSSDGGSSLSRSQENFRSRDRRSTTGSDEPRPRGPRHSAGDQDIRVLTPPWKTGGQVYSPPGRPTSPMPYGGQDSTDGRYAAGPRRSSSPGHRQRRPRSPSPPRLVVPGAYADNRPSRVKSPSRREVPRRRSSSRGRLAESQVVNPYPTSSPPNGRGYGGPYGGVDVIRPARQLSHEDRTQYDRRDRYPADLSASMPASLLQHHTQQTGGWDKKDKKNKKKVNKKSEAPQDHRRHQVNMTVYS